MADERIMALTVRQPWAHMIARCGKTVENRGWVTGYRGLLAIHAGAYSRWDRDAETSPVALRAWRRWSATLSPLNVTGPLRRDSIHIDFGAVIAVAVLAGSHHESTEKPRNSCSEWGQPGQYHWCLANIRPLPEPVPCKGKLSLWRLPENVEKAVRAQLVPLATGCSPACWTPVKCPSCGNQLPPRGRSVPSEWGILDCCDENRMNPGVNPRHLWNEEEARDARNGDLPADAPRRS